MTVYKQHRIVIRLQYNHYTNGIQRKSNDLFESVSQEFTLLIVLLCRNCHLCRE